MLSVFTRVHPFSLYGTGVSITAREVERTVLDEKRRLVNTDYTYKGVSQEDKTIQRRIQRRAYLTQRELYDGSQEQNMYACGHFDYQVNGGYTLK